MNPPRVSLVIPGRNCVRTIRECLDAVVPLLSLDTRRDYVAIGRAASVACQGLADPASRLDEIIFVDDGSTDRTPSIVAEYPVRLVLGPGGGPGAARNVGWRAAKNPLVWFIDSDCVAEPQALALLLAQMDDPKVAATGGSYSNRCPQSLLACLIHEEIVARHGVMEREVNFLGSFNVVYRRTVLEQLDGFDEKYFNGPGSPGAEDAELAYRVHEAGHVLRFEPRSRVGHYHPTRFWRYMRAQRHHGYWRVNLHLRHPSKAGGDAYSSMVDHCQPPLAMVQIAALPLLLFERWRWAAFMPLAFLVLAQIPMTVRLMWRTRRGRMIAFGVMSLVRAFARGIGMTYAVLCYPFR